MTDAEPYFDESISVLENGLHFTRLPWAEGDFFYPKTDFEEQWLAQGRTIHRLRLQRREVTEELHPKSEITS